MANTIETKPAWENFILLIAVILAWGLSWPLMKLLLTNLPPLWLGASRMAIATLALVSYLIIIKQFKIPTRKDLPILLTTGLIFSGAFTACINIGLAYVDAGRSAILAYCTPFWVAPIAYFVLKESFSAKKIIGLLLGLIGILFLFNPNSINWHNPHTILGNGLLLFASLLWAITIIHIRTFKWHLTPLQLAPWQMLLATVFLAIFACILEPHPAIHWTIQASILMIYISIVATAFAFWGSTEISKRLSAVTVSVTMLGVPIVGLISSMIILKEHISMLTLIAVCLLLLGLACIANASKN